MGNDIEGVEWAREYRGRGFLTALINLMLYEFEDYHSRTKIEKSDFIKFAFVREAHYFSNISRTVLFEALIFSLFRRYKEKLS